MPKKQSSHSGRTRVLDPHSGGRPIPDATQAIVRQRILGQAARHYAGKYTRIDVRFRRMFC